MRLEAFGPKPPVCAPGIFASGEVQELKAWDTPRGLGGRSHQVEGFDSRSKRAKESESKSRLDSISSPAADRKWSGERLGVLLRRHRDGPAL